MLRVNCFLIDANFLCQLATNTLLSPHLAPHPSSQPMAAHNQAYTICSNNNNFPNLYAELQISLSSEETLLMIASQCNYQQTVYRGTFHRPQDHDKH